MAPSTVSDKQSQNKRKASAAGIPNSSRPVKRRASKACCSCRARKVRCDVVESGSPCTNCRLDEVDCVVTESKRRKLVLRVFFKKVFSIKGVGWLMEFYIGKLDQKEN